MLVDWIWAFLVTLGVWFEITGWASLIQRLIELSVRSRARPRPPTLFTLALAFAVAAQIYFVFSLLGGTWGAPGLHLFFMVMGCVAFFGLLWRSRPVEKPKLHLKLARYFSPMIWKRTWPWLTLPALWTLLRLTDAIVPHNHHEPLYFNLLAPRRWFEDGGQMLEPLHPAGAFASVWEGLYYHVIALLQGSAPHRTALVRAQLSAQLLHFTAGEALTALLVARLIRPFIREGWDVFVHAGTSTPNAAQRRHQLGMASTVAIPSSLCFAWLACAQSSVAWTGTLAMNDWGAGMCVVAALAHFTQERYFMAWFLWGTSLAISHDGIFAGAGFFALTILECFSSSRTFSTLLRATAGAALGVLPWIYRNYSQAGVLFYPPLTNLGAGPGWFVLPRLSVHSPAAVDLIMRGFVVVGGLGVLVYLWRKRFVVKNKAMGQLAAFTSVTILASVFEPFNNTTYLPVAIVVLAALGIEFLITVAKAQRLAFLNRIVPYLWFGIGLVAIPLPIHVLWQNLSLAFASSDSYLAAYHRHHEAKHWAGVHLPNDLSIAWTSDDEFYYLEQRGAATRDSTIIHDVLMHSSNPSERARHLCELGFDILAWEDHRHGPEVAGLASWLRLEKATTLYSDDEVTLFDLRPLCHAF